ncbi:MAG: aminotransferase class V-fold PLP-dependent enzyme [Myxococcota bacterium]
MDSSYINLDANASVPVFPCAKKALLRVLQQQGNPSSPHGLGRQLRQVLDRARSAVACAVGGRDQELFFTSGASEGNRWLVDAVSAASLAADKPFYVVTTALEHASLSKPLKSAAAQGAFVLHPFCAVKQNGYLEILSEQLQRADVVFATAAHNETGLCMPWEQLLVHCRPDAIVMTDAAQAVARLPILPQRIDAVVMSAHKMGAVAGCGAVLLRGNARRLAPPWRGGSQEGGLRPGTEATALIAALGEAAKHMQNIRGRSDELALLRDALQEELLAAWPHAQVLAADVPRLCNTTAITLNGVDPEALRIAMDQTGVCVGFGSACSSLAPESSSALLAMGLSHAQARATMRFSLSHETTQQEIDEAIKRIVPVGLQVL